MIVSLFDLVLLFEFVAAAATALMLLFVTAPYGRHARAGWGPTLPTPAGWVLMEGASVVAFALTYWRGEHSAAAVPLVFLGLWMTHYLYRTVIYPVMIRGRTRQMPLLIVFMGMGFNVANGWLNAHWVVSLADYEPQWLGDPRFIVGATLMVTGFAIHAHSDRLLLRVRNSRDGHYVMPDRGLHRWVCNPNYLGEIVEWTGWAIATWSLSGLAFALFTIANLAPRARANLRWYRKTFVDYPADRKALIPGFF